MKKRNTWVTAIAIVLLAIAGSRVSAQKGYDTFQKALAAEKSDGNLNAAIKLYQQVVKEAGNDKALAARAWLRIGDCYQRLGDAQARDAFTQILNLFPDQADAAAQARSRLVTLGPAPVRGVSARLAGVQDGQVEFAGHVSLDGRLGGTDWFTGDVVLRDLATGQLTRLVKGGGSQLVESTWGENPVLSPDRTQVAYQWFGSGADSHQLRLISTQPGAKPRVLIGDATRFANPHAVAWSKDGRSLLIGLELKVTDTSTQPANQGDFQLAWLSVSDGGIKPIRTVEWWRSGGRRADNSLGPVSLSPDERYIAYSAAPVRGSQDRSVFIVPVTGSAPVEVIKGGVNESPVWTPDGNTVVFVSNRGGTYGLWTLALRNGAASGLPLLVKPDIGRVSLHGMTGAGSLYYTQDAGVDEVFVARIAVDGRMSPSNAQPIDNTTGRLPTWSRDGKELALRRQRADESADVVIRVVGSGEEHRWVPSNPALAPTPGRPMWLGDGTLQPSLNSKVRLRNDAGELKEVAAAVSLPIGVLSADGTTVYVPAPPQAANGMRNSRIVAYDTMTGQERRSFNVPDGVIGLALNPDGTTLAVTSIGHVSIIRTDGTAYRELYKSDHVHVNPYRVGWPRDGRSVIFTEDDERGRSRLMRISLDGGKPEPVGLDVDALSAFEISPDGSRIAYSARRNATEIWSLELGSLLRK